MNKKLSLLSSLIIAIFLSMQAFSLLHVSAYSFEKHEHDNKNCDICLSADQSKLLGHTPNKLTTPNLLNFKITNLKKTLPFSGKAQIFEARAPPFFS